MNDNFQMHLVRTVGGKRINPSAPDPTLIDINDIAYSMDGIHRFGGHTNPHIKLTDHSFLVSILSPDDLALDALMHDTPEYILQDLSSPVKNLVGGYSVLEDKMLNAIYYGLGIISEPIPEGQVISIHEDVKRVDSNVMAAESMFGGLGPMPVTDVWIYEKALRWLKADIDFTRVCSSTLQRFLDRYHVLRRHLHHWKVKE